jgi:hypothetical protein
MDYATMLWFARLGLVMSLASATLYFAWMADAEHKAKI